MAEAGTTMQAAMRIAAKSLVFVFIFSLPI
jgi:hypothetical protein